MSPGVLYTRIPDSRDILFMRSHIRQGTLIDVGANVGLVTLLLAEKIQHALLFEPNPLAAARARANLELNGLRFEVHALALSDTTGTVEFISPTVDPASGTFQVIVRVRREPARSILRPGLAVQVRLPAAGRP